MEREHIDATLILSNPLTFPNRVEMTAFALRHHVPTMVSLREYVEAGALNVLRTELRRPLPASRKLC